MTHEDVRCQNVDTPGHASLTIRTHLSHLFYRPGSWPRESRNNPSCGQRFRPEMNVEADIRAHSGIEKQSGDVVMAVTGQHGDSAR